MKSYTVYVTNYNRSVQVLHNAGTKYEKFAAEVRLQHPEVLLDLSSFLIMPIQRIPRYNLLLADLLKHTWKDHQDYAELTKACAAIAEVASYVNERKREAENIAKTLEVISQIQGRPENFIQPQRRFLKEGILGIEKKDQRLILLFSDVIVFCKSKGGLFSKKKDLHFEISHDLKDIGEINSVGNNIFSFTKPGLKDAVQLIAASPEERDEWMELMKKHIEEVKPRLKEKEVVAITDTKPAEQVLRERNLSKSAAPAGRPTTSTRVTLTASTKSSIGKLSPEKEKEIERNKKRQELLAMKKTVEESLLEVERQAGEKSKDKKEKKSTRKAKLDEFDAVKDRLKKDLEHVEKGLAELDKEDKK